MNIDMFWSKIELKTSGLITDCWNWTGYINQGGYGNFSKKKLYVHRISYELHKGLIPKGLTIDHTCRNRKCVNPDHLEAVTLKENVHRGNTITSINSRKTHCPKEHELKGDNLVKWNLIHSNQRTCRICRINNERKRYYK